MAENLCWETFHVSYERSRFLSCDILSQHGREFGGLSELFTPRSPAEVAPWSPNGPPGFYKFS